MLYIILCGLSASGFSQVDWPEIRNRNDNTIMERVDSLYNIANPRDSSFTIGSGSITADSISTDSIATGAIIYTDTYWNDLRVPLTATRITPANSEPDFEDCGNGYFADHYG